MRTFAIINDENLYDYGQNVLSKLDTNDDVYMFSKEQYADQMKQKYPDVTHVIIPREIDSHPTKTRNFVSKYFKDIGLSGFLHVLSRSIRIDRDPSEFLRELELMMKKLKNDVWFNCSCDRMNYVFSKINPRYILEIDDPETKSVYQKRIMLCSNANTEWVTYDMDVISYERMCLDEEFQIPMFYIIKYLADRRNNKTFGDFYYMNMYPTVPEEIGVFSNNVSPDDKGMTDVEKQKLMKKEDARFRDLGINFSPDHDIMQISEDLRNILISQK